MFLVIPIGHDRAIRHFPWLTVGIMAVCTLVQVRSCRSSVDEEQVARIEVEQRRLATAYVTRSLVGAPPGSEDDARPDPGRLAERLDNLRHVRPRDWSDKERDFAAGRGVDPNDPDRARYLELQRQLDELLARDPAFRWGYRPTDGISWRLITSGFVHGGWLHLIGNLLFLWLVGCNLEDRWGRLAFGGVYLAGMVAADLAYALAHPHGTVPAIGASGAISAAMGAFLINFHDVEIDFWYLWLLRLRVGTFSAKALFVMPFWFLKDALNAIFEVHVGGGGVAYSAHVGGFLFGVAAAVALRASGIEKKYLLPATAKGVEWEEDPDVVKAMDRRADGHPEEAVPLLRAVLVRNPSHPVAPVELVRCAVALGQRGLVEAHLPRAVAALVRSEAHEEVVMLVREVEAKWPGLVAPARTLADAARSASRTGYLADQRRLLGRLLAQAGGGALGARALRDLALLDEEEGRVVEARAGLERLIAEHPHEPLVANARERLAHLEGVAAPVRPADLDGRLAVEEPLDPALVQPDVVRDPALAPRPRVTGSRPRVEAVVEIAPEPAPVWVERAPIGFDASREAGRGERIVEADDALALELDLPSRRR